MYLVCLISIGCGQIKQNELSHAEKPSSYIADSILATVTPSSKEQLVVTHEVKGELVEEVEIPIPINKNKTLQEKKLFKKSKKKLYAKMTFDSVSHHLPSIIEGDHFKHQFRFVNTGKAPLSITGATSSCGCTTPSFSFLDVASGDSSGIEVDYYSVNKDGPQLAEIIITANTYPSKTKLSMEFEVISRGEESDGKIDTLNNSPE